MPAAIPGRVATQIRVNNEIYRKTKLIAQAESRNTNAQIEYFLKKGVEAYEAEHGVINLPDEN